MLMNHKTSAESEKGIHSGFQNKEKSVEIFFQIDNILRHGNSWNMVSYFLVWSIW